jgi:hypothetical protein
MTRCVALLLILVVSTTTATMVCRDYEYTEGEIHPAVFGTKPYEYINMDWLAEPPLDIKLGDSLRLSYNEFEASYPWARDVLRANSKLISLTISLVKLGAPGQVERCSSPVDAIDMYWEQQPSGKRFTSYPVRCNYDGSLMFAVDPRAHPIKDAWGDKPQWPKDGQHFAPRGGTASFESMTYDVRQDHRPTIPLTLAYFSGAEPHLEKLSTISCVDVDVVTLSNELVAKYEEFHVAHMSRRGSDTAPPDGNENKPFAPDEDPDQWALAQLRKDGFRVDLPLDGKLAPPTLPPPPPRVSPYEEEADPDALLTPNEQLNGGGQENGDAKVLVSAGINSAAIAARLWPFLECVKNLGDGTCIAYFGYTLASDTAVDVPEAPEENWLEPEVYREDFDLTTHFEPGKHSKGFLIRWICVGDALTNFVSIYWTLKGATASATQSSPECDAGAQDQAMESEAHGLVDKARRNPGMRKLFQLDPTTTPPATTSCTDTGSCDGVLQPRLECTHNFENGTCVSYFGYLNEANYTVHRDPSFAANNFFTPIAEDQGQPATFLPGRQYYVATVYWFCQQSSGVPGGISWVMNTTATASSATHNTCPVGCDDIPFSNTTNCPTSSSTGSPFSSMSSAAAVSSSSAGPVSSSSAGPVSAGPVSSSAGPASSSSAGPVSSYSSSSSSSTGIIPTPCPPPPPCQFGATLALYRDRNFTHPYRPPKQFAGALVGQTSPYGLLKLEVPEDWLADFCLNVREVVECLCNDTSPCQPFDPARPGVTGCNSPGVLKRYLYRQSPPISNDGFAFVSGPPTYCSGERAFTWVQQMVAPPGNKLLVQAKWSYTALSGNGDHNCTGTSQGGSGAVYNCCSCPSTHEWNNGCGCCRPVNLIAGNTTVNVNVTIINVINITIPDQSGSAVSAIASATASVAVATATAAATSTTGNIIIIIDQTKPHWWGWLLIGLASAIAIPCVLCALWIAGAALFGPAPQPDYQVAVVEEEPQPQVYESYEVVTAGQFTAAPIGRQHPLDLGRTFSVDIATGELVKKHTA